MWKGLHMLAALAISLVGLFHTDQPLRDKTLVAWASPANLDQRGGSVLTLDDRTSKFDAIVLGELAPKKWMAGSETFNRTNHDQAAWPEESSERGQPVQIAIVYRGRTITIYRAGKPAASYTINEKTPLAEFGAQTVVIAGMRHLAQSDNARFAGAIDDLRVYDAPLSVEQIAELKPNAPNATPLLNPWACWTFDGKASDITGRFKATRLVGGAKIENGQLVLDGKTGSMFAAASEADLDSVIPTPPDPRLAENIETVRKFRNKLLADRHRPTYHFVIPEDYAMPFDPNGAIYWKGRYHLFYIYQERGAHWFGHVSSIDLVHWRQHPPALGPHPGDVDKGMFSGNCFINKKGEATMLYHGVGAGNCIATSSDDLLEHWTKLATNPIIPIAPKDAPYRSWDPHGWLEGDTYYAIFGGERAAIFKARNLDRWTHVGDLLHHTVPGVDLREDISCPDLFKLGGKDVLVCISHRLGARYYVGEWKNEQFHPIVHERMSWVDNLYFAPESVEGPNGRRVMWAWIFDRRPEPMLRASGWSGEMALPRELTLGADNRLRMKPIDELKQLRYDAKTLGQIDLSSDETKPLEGISGDALELEVVIEPKGAKRVGVEVRRSPDGAEKSTVFLDLAAKKLGINEEAGPFEPAGATVTLRVFVDRGVVEAFADDRQAVVRRAYPARTNSLGVAVFTTGGAATIRRIAAWKMFPSNAY